MDLTTTAENAERCQRNWDYERPVSQEHVDTIVHVATTMPTKNNRKYYELLVSTNQDFNRMCYTHAVDPRNLHFQNKEIHRNTQVVAPLLLIWRPVDLDSVDNPFRDDYRDDFLISTGISSGAAVLAANSLGYRTGYCTCFDTNELYESMQDQFGVQHYDRTFRKILTVGIGHPHPDFSRRDCVLDGVHGFTAETRNKQIDITTIT